MTQRVQYAGQDITYLGEFVVWAWTPSVIPTRIVRGEVRRSAGARRLLGAPWLLGASRRMPVHALSPRIVRGEVRRSVGRAVTCPGAPPRFRRYEQPIKHRYRIAEDALDRYEIYVGTDASPDLTAAPTDTTAALPWTSGALAPGHDYHVVTRRRNAYNLDSGNAGETVIRVAADGSESSQPPSSPTWSVGATTGTAVRITASYDSLRDASDGVAADTWVIWLQAGSAPDPDTDSPAATQTLTPNAGVASLDYTSASFGAGVTVHALVRVRDSDGADSVNTATASAVTATTWSGTASARAALGGASEERR